MVDFLGDFREVLTRGEDLPTLPNLVFELHSALDREDVRTSVVAEIIERDPALATRLLRVANSSAFNRGTQIDSVGGAIQMLGLNQVRALSMALAVVNAFSQRRGGLALRSFWQHSAAVAFLARSLAQTIRAGKVAPDQAYLGGLLHDVGLLLMDQFFPDWMQQSLVDSYSNAAPLCASEDKLLGVDHGEIGGFLLGRWSIPPTIVQMVASHHTPAKSPAAYRNACWTVHAAEVVCSGQGHSLSVEGLDTERSLVVVDMLRDAGYDIDSIIEELTESADGMATALV